MMNEKLLLCLCVNFIASDTEIRLAGGRYASEGRLEFFTGNKWGSVCYDSFFNFINAAVMCQQLGFTGVNEIVSEEVFGPGNVSVLIDNVMCQRDDILISGCSTPPPGQHNCRDSEGAVGIVCCKCVCL